MTAPLWEPSRERIEQANLTAFMAAVTAEWGTKLTDYESLWQFSVEQPEKFWSSVWSHCGVIAETRGEVVIENLDRMPGARFFPDARLNFAENLLRRRDDSPAIIFRGEDRVRRTLTHKQLYDAVSRLAQGLHAQGVGQGDRVGGYLPNMPETIIGMLATASIGAVWSSCSPDFGVEGVLDRFGQIEPRVLIGVEGYYYNGQAHDCLEKLSGIAGHLPSLRQVIVVPYTREAPPIDDIRHAILLSDFVAQYDACDIAFEPVHFNDPLYILYSSGTTGVPKCMIHGGGGILLKHLTEHQFHTDVRPHDRIFYFTTCGWMMWNWLASGLASEATLLLYDGAPFHPNPNALFDFADAEGMTLFGTSAKFIDAAKNAGMTPAETHSLATVRTMTSTGSPLAPEGFDFVYQKIKKDIHLASISGGTDICGCFMLGNPIGPVWRGEIQARALGVRMDVFSDDGRAIRGEKGELVCTQPFPSMPVSFWNDPDGSKYRAAYFERFPDVWCQGDYVMLTEHNGIIMYGRSDAVLNPGGVRIGTAEIYRQVEQLEDVVEALVIGQEWDNDTRVVLFVVLRPDVDLDDTLRDRIKSQVRRNASPRHVPAKILQVADIPRTRSGKITELAVRDVVHGRPIKNREALANPEALELFANLPELQA